MKPKDWSVKCPCGWTANDCSLDDVMRAAATHRCEEEAS